ncbi:MAG: hypothetical protein HZA11_12560 [Nitrospirae bacterium]|nr:hypothetical protein [Nitrospirota bacterium]
MKETATLFRKAIELVFNHFLADYGFLKTKSTADKNGFSVTYRNDKRYVHLGGTLHPHDYPYYYYLSFGEGSDDFLESDWNSTALWRIIQHKSPADYKKHKDLYDIPPGITKKQIEEKILTNQKLCEIYGSAFFNNDLTEFKLVRSLQNKDREPYKIYTPDNQGKYSMSYDEQSTKLKKKYS